MAGSVLRRGASVARAGGRDRGFAIPRLGLVLSAALAMCGIVLATAALAAERMGRPLAYLTREPSSAIATEGACEGAACSLAGIVSNIGGVIWIAAATVCLVVAYAVWHAPRRREARSAFLYAGLLTAALGLDDLLMVHDALASLAAGAELLIYAVYAFALLGFLFVYRRLLRQTSAWVLLAAAALLVASAGFDQVLPGLHMYEDGSKLVGIVLWATFFVGTGLVVLRSGSRPDA